MSFYNKFSIDESGNPLVIEIETDNPELSGTNNFEDLQGLTEQEWQAYWQKVLEMYGELLPNIEQEAQQVETKVIDFQSYMRPATISTRELSTILQILGKIPERQRVELLNILKDPELYPRQEHS